jgi:hypothetical protein
MTFCIKNSNISKIQLFRFFASKIQLYFDFLHQKFNYFDFLHQNLTFFGKKISKVKEKMNSQNPVVVSPFFHVIVGRGDAQL